MQQFDLAQLIIYRKKLERGSEMFDVAAIMTTDVITVEKRTPINKAMEIMAEHNITGLPVVNDDMTLAGIISEKDVLGLLHDFENSSLTVEDFMTKDIVAFDENANLIDVCDFLIKNHFRRVPIVSQGRLIGIVTRSDIVQYIVDYQQFFENIPHTDTEPLALL